MAEMGDTFRRRLADGPQEPLQFPEPSVPMLECDGCRTVLREDEMFDGLCESCALDAREDPRWEWDFVRDFQL